jgi:hypothetical protein
MSGFEPVVAEAVIAEAGTSALAAEVMAPEILAATAGASGAGGASGLAGISGLFGTGLEGAAANAVGGGASGLAGIGGLFGSGIEGVAANGGLGTLAQSAVPTMAEQLVTANPAALGQLQNAVLPGMTPDQLAQITGGIPTPGVGAQVASVVPDLAGSGVTPEMLNTGLNASVQDLSTANLIEPGGYTGQGLTPGEEHLALRDAASKINPQTNPFSGFTDMIKGAYKDFKEMPTKDKMLYGGVASLAAPTIMGMLKKKKELGGITPYDGPLSKYSFDPASYRAQQLAQPDPYRPRYASGGDVESFAFGGLSGVGFGKRKPAVTPPQFAVPVARAPVAPPTPYKARYAQGGVSDLGGYSDYAGGGRMLKGPGDGMSDNIPASIAGKQPARLANEEFVIPADVVSHLGNGSSEAGAKQLYKMMDRVRQARTGNKKQGKQIKPAKYMPV